MDLPWVPSRSKWSRPPPWFSVFTKTKSFSFCFKPSLLHLSKIFTMVFLNVCHLLFSGVGKLLSAILSISLWLIGSLIFFEGLYRPFSLCYSLQVTECMNNWCILFLRRDGKQIDFLGSDDSFEKKQIIHLGNIKTIKQASLLFCLFW